MTVLPHSPDEANDIDAASPRPPKLRRACGRSRAGGVDIVDEQHATRDLTAREKRPGHVSPPFRSRQVALALHTRATAQRRLQGNRPCRGEFRGQGSGGGMATGQAAVVVCGNGRDEVHRRPRHDGDDKLGCGRREVAPPAFLPRPDEGAGAVVVHKCSADTREREPPAAAFGTAANGPGSGSPAAVTPRRCAADEASETAGTDRLADPATDATAARQQHVEKMHTIDGRPKTVPKLCRLRARSAPSRR